MRLESIASISHGLILNRIEARGDEEATELSHLTIAELGTYLGIYNNIESTKVKVSPSKLASIPICKASMVVVSLTSIHQAMLITDEQEGKVITSNFAYIELDKSKIDAGYFVWYFNNHPDIGGQLNAIIQGTATVRVMSVQMIRGLDIKKLPPMHIQQLIGKAYQLQLKRNRLLLQKQELEKILHKEIFIRLVNRRA